MMAAPSFGSPRFVDDPHALAVRILSERRFRVRIPPRPQHTWLDWAWQWILDRWNSLIDAFARGVHLGRHASVAFGDFAIALVVAVVVVACVRLAMQMTRDRAPASPAALAELRENAKALYDRALGASHDGRYAAAIVLLFRATLAALDIRHAIDERPSRTVNECKTEVRARAPRLFAPFDQIARAFTAVAYAGAPATERDWAAVRSVYDVHFARRFDEA